MKKNQEDILYWKITDLWKRFCEEHTILLDKTFEEYSLLLSSEIEKLEIVIEEKNTIVSRISHLEMMRREIIEQLNEIGTNKISNVSELLSFMNKLTIEKEQKHLFRFNALLIDIISKIQDQNKKNQLFINKAIHSLQAIREETLGTKNYSTYNSKGSSTKALGRI